MHYHGILAPGPRLDLGPRPPRILPFSLALLARVYAADMTLCPARGGRLRLVAGQGDPESIRSYLTGVDLAPPPRPCQQRVLPRSAAKIDERFKNLQFLRLAPRSLNQSIHS